MALLCPSCSAEIHGEFVNIQMDTAMCAACGEVFRPSAVLAAGKKRLDMPLPDPPPSNIVDVQYAEDSGISIFLPRRGLGTKALSVFFFALFWNVIVCAVFSGFLMGMIKNEFPWALTLFFLPFFIVGFVSIYWGCWMAWGSTTVELDNRGLYIVKGLLGINRTKEWPLDKIEPFTQEAAYTQNDKPILTCTVNVGNKQTRFGHALSESHQEWVVNELNRVLALLKSRA